jgi:2-succinyl-5-enolpyruvyl-6-hydroxy-3-cyclohexene-1-carboxylate synthase
VGNPSTDFAVALFGEFIRRGIRDVVLCPGSRSQALALAAAAYERAGLIRLRVRIDERVAGFLALGIAVETRTPVLVVTTSGTAVANLHPAVLEAHHAGIPLILMTADRPAELRGIGSNQTTDQVGIFGPAVGWIRDVEAPSHTGFDLALPGELAHESFSAAAGHSGQPGPVQLNLSFREPLSGPVAGLPTIEHHDWPDVARDGATIERSPHTIVIAGDASGPDAEALAHELGVPLIAEVSSGSRFGPNLVVAYRQLLRDDDFGGRVERAIVFGHPTLSREIPALLQRADVAVTVIRSAAAEAYNPGHRAMVVSGPVRVAGRSSSAATDDRAWLGRWVQASRALLETPAPPGPLDDSPGGLAREQLAAFRQPVTRASLAQAVWCATWPHDRLVLGASRLIREADAVVPGKKIPVHANRGLAGIDGTIATGIGIALASQGGGRASQEGGARRGVGDSGSATGAGTGGASGITRVMLGDLATLYDAGAMLFGGGEARPRIQVIVGNDGGGTIFDSLEVAASADPTSFDRVQFTPQNVDLAALAAAYGWDYRRVANVGELDAALAPSASPVLIEVPLPRT